MELFLVPLLTVTISLGALRERNVQSEMVTCLAAPAILYKLCNRASRGFQLDKGAAPPYNPPQWAFGP